MNEHRLPDRLINYWNTIRKDAAIPDFGHFNPSSVADVWQYCVLFTVDPAVENKPFTISFSRVGDKVRDVYGKDMAGKTFNTNQRHFQGAAIVRRMEATIESPAVLTDTGQFINERSKVVKFRSCLLPFGREGNITHVVVGITWREY
jgi:hypothetical protein